MLPGSAPARKALVLGSAGVAAGIGVLGIGPEATVTASSAPHTRAHTPALPSQAQSLIADHVGASAHQVSRSEIRPPLRREQRATKAAALPVRKQDVGGSVTTSVPPASPQQIALSMLPSYGWDSGQFSCLDAVWTRESNWDPYVANSSSGAYGIPQALPASKMAAFGSDWSTNPTTQIKWGLWYIRQSYGSPCGAWAFWQSHNWY